MSATTRTLICDVVIPGNPTPKGRPRVHNGHAMTPLRTVQAEQRVGWLVKAALAGFGGPTPAPVAVEARFYERRQPGQEADIDNLAKLLGDALNMVVWEDDRQIVEWVATIERGAKRPRTELRIWALEEA